MQRDQGWAWLVAAATFTSQFLSWGISDAFGVLIVDLLDSFQAGEAATALVGSIQVFLMYSLGLFAEPILDKFGWRVVVITGAIFICLGFVLTSLTPTVYLMYLTYGVLVGIGCSALYYPSITIIQLYFKKYRGVMLGLAVTGGGLGTTVFPIFWRVLLNQLGWRWTLVITGALSLIGIVAGLAFRHPVFSDDQSINDTTLLLQSSTSSSSSTPDPPKKQRIIDCTLCRNPEFTMFAVYSCMYMTGYIIVYTFLPLKAIKADGVDSTWAAFLVSAIGLSSLFCRLPAGWLSDKGLYLGLIVNGLCIFIAGVACLMMPLWRTFPALVLYSVVCGATTGIAETLFYSNLTNLMGEEMVVKATGQVEFLSSFTLLLASPLSGLLIQATKTYDTTFMLAGTAFVLAAALVLGIAWRHRNTERLTSQCISLEKLP